MSKQKKMRPDNPDVIRISLDGVYVGKTSQMDLMPECFEVQKNLNFDTLLLNEQKFEEWWLDTTKDEDYLAKIRWVNDRWDTATSKDVVIFDQGTFMLKSVCVAGIASKKKCDVAEAEKIYKIIRDKFGFVEHIEDIRILLKYGENPQESLDILQETANKNNRNHIKYLDLLHQQLIVQESSNAYTNVINVKHMSVVQVQNEIRMIINKYITMESKPIALLKPIFENVKAIVAFAGLPKSGKTSLAKDVCNKLGIIGIKCTTLKVDYFMEHAPNHLKDLERAEYLVKQLDRYLRWHNHLVTITIESCNHLGTIKGLQLLLGSLLQIVYVDTCKTSSGNTEELTDKSSIETVQIKYHTDCFVLENNGKNTVDESSNAIYEMIKTKYEAIATQALLHNRYSGKINLFSQQFVLSAGSVLIHKSSRRICLIHKMDKKDEWLLPKGRKDVGETLQEAAVRETYEETGYRCSLMPVTMETRATPSGKDEVHDVARNLNNVIEPYMISLRQIGGSITNQKIIFWYVTQVDEDSPKSLDTQMWNENFEAQLLTLDEANKLLSFDDDKLLVQTAFKLFEKSF